MRDGWVQTRLDEVANVTMGQSPPGSTYNDQGNGLPFIQGNGEFGTDHPTPNKWCSEPRKVAQRGDVLLSVRAPVGATNIANRETAIGRGLAVLTGKPGLAETRFIRLLLQGSAPALAVRSTGSTFDAITGKALKALPVSVPPIEEQRRIVDLMSHVDTTLAADRSESVALAKCASSLRADTFSHPEGPRLVGDVYQITTGKQLQSSNTTGECFEYVRAGNIGEGGVLDLAVMKSMYFSSQEIDRLALCAGDVLIVEGGNGFGKSAIWPGSDQVTGYQNHVLRVRSTSEQYPPELAYQWSRWCHENGLFKPTGTGIPSLGLRRVKAMPVPGNSPQLMEAVRTLTTIEQALDARRQAAERCERLRSAFLAALVSGGHSIPVSYDEFIRDEGAA